MNVDETSCPFCTGALALANLAPRVAPRVRLGRAAVFAFGVAALAQGCGDNLPGKAPPDAASIPPDAARDASVVNDADIDGSVAIYAAAPTQDGGTAKRS